MKRFLSLVLAAMLLASLALPAEAAGKIKATTIRLEKASGTVTIQDASGVTMKYTKGMRLTSGCKLTTGSDSSAYVSLDNEKAVMLDSFSSAKIKQSGRKLQIQLLSGELVAYSTAPLQSNESLEIRTSTMVTGIRGSICVSKFDAASGENAVGFATGHGNASLLGGAASTVIPLSAGEKVRFLERANPDRDGAEHAAAERSELTLEDFPCCAQELLELSPAFGEQLLRYGYDTEELTEVLQEKEALLEAQRNGGTAPESEGGTDVTPAAPEETAYPIVWELAGGAPADGVARTAAEAGETVAFPTVSREGYTLTGWRSDDAELGENGFTMPPRAVTVTAEWVQNSYAVTLPEGEGYTAAAAEGSESPVAHGGSYSFTVTPDEGYENSELTVKADGETLCAVDKVYTIENITAPVTVTVEGTAKNSYAVTLPEGEGYTAAAAEGSESPAAHGGSYSFTVTLNAGCENGILTVMAGGEILTPADGGVYTIENITAPVCVTAELLLPEPIRDGDLSLLKAYLDGLTAGQDAFFTLQTKAGAALAYPADGDTAALCGVKALQGSVTAEGTYESTYLLSGTALTALADALAEGTAELLPGLVVSTTEELAAAASAHQRACLIGTAELPAALSGNDGVMLLSGGTAEVPTGGAVLSCGVLFAGGALDLNGSALTLDGFGLLELGGAELTVSDGETLNLLNAMLMNGSVTVADGGTLHVGPAKAAPAGRDTVNCNAALKQVVLTVADGGTLTIRDADLELGSIWSEDDRPGPASCICVAKNAALSISDSCWIFSEDDAGARLVIEPGKKNWVFSRKVFGGVSVITKMGGSEFIADMPDDVR